MELGTWRPTPRQGRWGVALEPSPRGRNMDHPEDDANVKALGGFDIAALTVAEMREAGVVLRPRTPLPGKDAKAWRAHSDYALDDTRGDAMDRAYARLATRQHVANTGKVEGVRLLRTFPCLGVYRYVDANEDLVQCDVCGDELAIRQVPTTKASEDDEAEAERAQAKWGDDDIPL